MGRKYKCSWCGWIYDPSRGDPSHGAAPGTPFDSLPDDWRCPACNAPKDEFILMEMEGVKGL